nr:unnamed protein product [Digitaria exilis]
MRRNTLLALFIWAMVAAIFAVAMPAAARRDGIHPQDVSIGTYPSLTDQKICDPSCANVTFLRSMTGCRCCYFTRNGFWIQCGKACCGSDDENCCLGTH